MYQFDLIRFLDDHFPDLADLADGMRTAGAEAPTLEAMRKWRMRGSYPASVLGALLVILEDRGALPASFAVYWSPKCVTSASTAKPTPTGSQGGIFD